VSADDLALKVPFVSLEFLFKSPFDVVALSTAGCEGSLKFEEGRIVRIQRFGNVDFLPPVGRLMTKVMARRVLRFDDGCRGA
jgi:hypothetical protein